MKDDMFDKLNSSTETCKRKWHGKKFFESCIRRFLEKKLVKLRACAFAGAHKLPRFLPIFLHNAMLKLFWEYWIKFHIFRCNANTIQRLFPQNFPPFSLQRCKTGTDRTREQTVVKLALGRSETSFSGPWFMVIAPRPTFTEWSFVASAFVLRRWRFGKNSTDMLFIWQGTYVCWEPSGPWGVWSTRYL